MGLNNRTGVRRLLRTAVVGAAGATMLYGGIGGSGLDPAGTNLAGAGLARAEARAAAAHPVTRANPETRRLAVREVSGGVRVTLTATRISTYDAYVHINTYRWKGKGWHRVDKKRVRTTWFWYLVTAKDGVCGFVVRPLPHRHANVGVSLVASGSTGCSPLYRYTVPR